MEFVRHRLEMLQKQMEILQRPRSCGSCNHTISIVSESKSELHFLPVHLSDAFRTSHDIIIQKTVANMHINFFAYVIKLVNQIFTAVLNAHKLIVAWKWIQCWPSVRSMWNSSISLKKIKRMLNLTFVSRQKKTQIIITEHNSMWSSHMHSEIWASLIQWKVTENRSHDLKWRRKRPTAIPLIPKSFSNLIYCSLCI